RLEDPLVGEVRFSQLRGWEIPFGMVLLRRWVIPPIRAGFLDVNRLPHNVRALGCVHLYASFSVPRSISDAFSCCHSISTTLHPLNAVLHTNADFACRFSHGRPEEMNRAVLCHESALVRLTIHAEQAARTLSALLQ